MPQNRPTSSKIPTGSTAVKSSENVSLFTSRSHLQKPYANFYETKRGSPKIRITLAQVAGFGPLSLLF